MSEKKGILTVISGFSGVGKGTIVNRLVQDYPQDYCLSVSVTTRSPRVGEKDGISYFFVSEEEFQKMIAERKLLEYAVYVDHYYGTPQDFVLKKLAEGVNVILEIEMQGALKVKEQFPQSLLIFVAPQRAQILADRLKGRGTETSEQIDKRLHRAVEETQYIPHYDYLVINDEIDRTVRQIHEIVTNEKSRVSRQDDFIQFLTADLKSFVG